jgi:hypothetical protein
MDKRKENKGTIGNSGGRKSKAEEQQLIEKLSPLEPIAHEKLKEAIEGGKEWAVKLFFDYMYGKPKQMIENKNINYDAGVLTPEEAKMINEQLNSTY